MPGFSVRPAPPLLAALLVSALAACAVGPDYRRPAAGLTALSAPAALASDPRPAPPLARWWLGFDDAVLTGLITRGEAQNLDLAMVLARVEQARAAARAAGARMLPDLAMSNQVARERQSLESPLGELASQFPGYSRDATQTDLDLAASWELDLFGGLARQREAALAEAEAAVAAGLGRRLILAGEIAESYLALRADQSRLTLLERQVAALSEVLALARQRYGRGLAARREVDEAEAALIQARAARPLLEIDRAAQENRLAVLVGEQPGRLNTLLERPAPLPRPPAVPAEVRPADLLARRPDIIAAERQLAAATAGIGAAVADYYPKFTLQGVAGYESLHGSDLIKASTFQPLAAAGMTWRLFDFGAVDAEVAAAKGARAEALARYRQTLLRAAEDVENALEAVAALRQRQEDLARRAADLAQSRDSLRAAEMRGLASRADLRLADSRSLQAEDDLAEARGRTARAVVAAFRAMGGGWGGEGRPETGQPVK
ncbi:outer membrane protein OprM precursor [mine drainage metagenome]|uniref:Outer membrane protein OprM n=1 Tax=mine drainage metagenome TaxID=410659 RepID=A0A1J5R2A8_9ZZZZ